MIVGLTGAFEAEAVDRDHMQMPAQMDKLVAAVLDAQPNTAVVLCNGSPVCMPWVGSARAVLEMYLGGQASGGAMADVVFGKCCPSGKLAETFPLAAEDSLSHPYFMNHPSQLIYREGLNVGYRYFATAGKPVLFPFGHGLSYTSFGYSNLTLSATTLGQTESLQVTFDVTNTGSVEGAEVVQLYVADVEASVHRPALELREFGEPPVSLPHDDVEGVRARGREAEGVVRA